MLQKFTKENKNTTSTFAIYSGKQEKQKIELGQKLAELFIEDSGDLALVDDTGNTFNLNPSFIPDLVRGLNELWFGELPKLLPPENKHYA
tara:strand:+ start:919 stop:1188 length:270 start_codon:yes stop_codon:yes gene_type:complete